VALITYTLSIAPNNTKLSQQCRSTNDNDVALLRNDQ